MKSSAVLLATFVAAASASMSESELFNQLLKRQEPGSPAYNCHNNCGSAITLSKGSSDFCSNEAFKSDYANCLQCSGPDNVNIWRLYGRTLTTAGEKCKLSTTPLSGKQPDVPDAKPASSSAAPSSAASSVASSAAPSTTSSAASSVVSSIQTPATTPGASSVVSSVASSVAESTFVVHVPSSAVVSSVVSSAVASTTAGGSYSVVPTRPATTASVSGGIPPNGNGTSTFVPPPPQQTTNGATGLQLSDVATMFIFAIMGVMYLGN